MKSRLYHIDIHGKIVECKAKLRECPRKDYQTKEAAYTALHLQEEESNLDKIEKELTQLIRDPNTPNINFNLDFSSHDSNHTARKLVQAIDDFFLTHGEEPAILKTYSTIRQTGLPENGKHTVVDIIRVPEIDRNNYIMGGTWYLNSKQTSDPRFGHTVKDSIEIRLNDDYENEIKKARQFVKKAVEANKKFTPNLNVEEETNKMMEQITSIYSTLEEESRGPYHLWEEQNFTNVTEPIGTFKNSTMTSINVDTEYNNSNFRGKIFQEFFEQNTAYHAVSPEINIRVYELDKTPNVFWSIFNDKGIWGLQLRDKNNNIQQIEVNTPEEAENILQKFLHENSSDPTTINEKSAYVYELMNDIDNVITQNKNEIARKVQQDEERSQQLKNKQSLFGNYNKKSTIGNILDMFS